MRIGVGVTTRNRNSQALDTLGRIAALAGEDFEIAVVDDSSDVALDMTAAASAGASRFHRFDRNEGVARSKNKCLELLADCDHIFLFDDDAYPIAEGWWWPYVESREPHLMYQFLDLAGPRKLGDVAELYRGQGHVALSGPRGVMLYVERRVLDVVGGMDPIFSPWGYEHGDWSNRIHAAGLTTWRYADVEGSSDLVYSLDEHEAIERSVPAADRQAHVRRNAQIHNRRREEGFAGFVPYLEPSGHNVVLTALFAGQPDPQRPDAPRLGFEDARTLVDSLNGERLVVLGDVNIPAAEARSVWHELGTNVYFERWIAAWQWLRDNEGVGYVCIVDATDVEMLASPWSRMTSGVLYIGHEPTVVNCRWMRTSHPSTTLARFMSQHGSSTLLNPGVIGGDRATVMAFLHAIIRAYFDIETRAFARGEGSSGVGDMGVVNMVAYTQFADVVEWGPHWVTRFKAYETDNTEASFRHK